MALSFALWAAASASASAQASESRASRAKAVAPATLDDRAQRVDRPADGDHALARSLTVQAMRAYRSGQYALALDRFQAAYARVPAPELLFNVGQCYRQLHRDEAAKAVFEAYLRALPAAPERAEIEGWIATRERQHAVTPSAAALAGRSAAPSGVDRALGVGTAAHTRERDDGPELYERWWFWTAVCAVAVGGSVTAAYLIESNDAGEAPPAGSLGTVRWN